jgi:regulator of replication initiation timing
VTAPAPKRKPGDVLREARRKQSDRKRSRVFRTVDAMKRDGTEISFAAVARGAGVSNWLVYADGVRHYIEAAREAQAARPVRSERTGRTASDASLRTDLELTRQDNRALREESARLKQILRERLGEQLEIASSETLRQRVDTLTEANNRYGDENRQLRAESEQLRERLQTTEDDLAAARTSIRRMIRAQTDEIAPNTMT